MLRTLVAISHNQVMKKYACWLKIFCVSIEMHDVQGVLQMQQLKRMLSTEASGAQSDRPQHAGHHLHLRAQPSMAYSAQRAGRVNAEPPRQEQQRQLRFQELTEREATAAERQGGAQGPGHDDH